MPTVAEQIKVLIEQYHDAPYLDKVVAEIEEIATGEGELEDAKHRSSLKSLWKYPNA